MKKIIIKICPVADKDHKISKRNYAHVFHYKNTICVAHDYIHLPMNYWSGILAHEIGHLLTGEKGCNKLEDIECEESADNAFKKKSDIIIKYKNSNYGHSLQYLSNGDIVKFDKFLDDYDLEYKY